MAVDEIEFSAVTLGNNDDDTNLNACAGWRREYWAINYRQRQCLCIYVLYIRSRELFTDQRRRPLLLLLLVLPVSENVSVSITPPPTIEHFPRFSVVVLSGWSQFGLLTRLVKQRFFILRDISLGTMAVVHRLLYLSFSSSNLPPRGRLFSVLY